MVKFLRNNAVLLIGATLLVSLWLTFRTSATPIASAAALEGMLGQGEPVLLEFFGNT